MQGQLELVGARLANIAANVITSAFPVGILVNLMML